MLIPTILTVFQNFLKLKSKYGIIILKEIQNGNIRRFVDFNNDGKLDAFEKAAEFGAFMQMIESEEQDEEDNEDETECLKL